MRSPNEPILALPLERAAPSRAGLAESFWPASPVSGGLESGAVAALFGAAPAALLSGIGTSLIVALWAALFPELRGQSDWRPPTPRCEAEAILR